MKKPTKKDKSRVEDFLEKMQWLFGVQNFDRQVVYKKKDDDSKMATVSVQEDYQRITISIYPSFWEETKREQAQCLLHELVHYLTNPLNDFGITLLQGKLQTLDHHRIANETTTCRVENILAKLLEGKMKWAYKDYQNYFKKK